MPTDKRDAQALAYIARRLRAETRGCREWDDAGTYAKVSELIGQNLALAVERVLCHATDPEAKTPGAILRNFTPPKPSEREKSTFPVPTAAEECPKHAGQPRPPYCGPCNVEKYGRETETSPDLPRVEDVSPSLAARLAKHAEETP